MSVLAVGMFLRPWESRHLLMSGYVVSCFLWCLGYGQKEAEGVQRSHYVRLELSPEDTMLKLGLQEAYWSWGRQYVWLAVSWDGISLLPTISAILWHHCATSFLGHYVTFLEIHKSTFVAWRATTVSYPKKPTTNNRYQKRQRPHIKRYRLFDDLKIFPMTK